MAPRNRAGIHPPCLRAPKDTLAYCPCRPVCTGARTEKFHPAQRLESLFSICRKDGEEGEDNNGESRIIHQPRDHPRIPSLPSARKLTKHMRRKGEMYKKRIEHYSNPATAPRPRGRERRLTQKRRLSHRPPPTKDQFIYSETGQGKVVYLSH